MAKEKKCPFKAKCDECILFVHLQGENPQTGDKIDQEGCALSWIPLLLVENSRQMRSNASAIESLRNEVLKPLAVTAAALTKMTALAERSVSAKLPPEIGG
jgi:hypothetical protein